jgi:uroporphyrinogen decarboxylase
VAEDGGLFLAACRGERTPRPPVWIMRQAGRYLPDYREVRARHDFLTVCTTPELAAQVTLQPVARLGVDAAILFSDILVPAAALGIDVAFDPGPIVARPVRTADDVARLPAKEIEAAVPYVFEAIRIVRRELAGRVPLIGFAASPFTLAAYLTEGEGSRTFSTWKRMIYGAPETAHALLSKLTATTVAYVTAQVCAGAQAIQIFDTWAGLVPAREYAVFDLPYARRVVDAIREAGAPSIYFAVDAGHAAAEIARCGADVLGIDWRTSLADAARGFGPGAVLQGNLDPCALLTDPATVRRLTGAMLDDGGGARAHIANLGHGILPETPVECAIAFVEAVKDSRA